MNIYRTISTQLSMQSTHIPDHGFRRSLDIAGDGTFEEVFVERCASHMNTQNYSKKRLYAFFRNYLFYHDFTRKSRCLTMPFHFIK